MDGVGMRRREVSSHRVLSVFGSASTIWGEELLPCSSAWPQQIRTQLGRTGEELGSQDGGTIALFQEATHSPRTRGSPSLGVLQIDSPSLALLSSQRGPDAACRRSPPPTPSWTAPSGLLSIHAVDPRLVLLHPVPPTAWPQVGGGLPGIPPQKKGGCQSLFPALGVPGGQQQPLSGGLSKRVLSFSFLFLFFSFWCVKTQVHGCGALSTSKPLLRVYSGVSPAVLNGASSQERGHGGSTGFSAPSSFSVPPKQVSKNRLQAPSCALCLSFCLSKSPPPASPPSREGSPGSRCTLSHEPRAGKGCWRWRGTPALRPQCARLCALLGVPWTAVPSSAQGWVESLLQGG